MNDNMKPLDDEYLDNIHEMFDELVEFIGTKDVDMNVIMHALCRTVAYGGVQMGRYDTMTKNHFVAMVVESVSAHYDAINNAIDESGVHDE